MKIIIEGMLLSIYKSNDFKDKETGEVSHGKHKLQLLVENELQNGSVKNEMQDISIPDTRVKEYEAQIGKKVQVKCDFVTKGQINFYVK
ncbi:hypothetical protein [Sulfuricurvum sp.]|jgi:hypothetical protein|uniref:hypothetical protein n=1 Tax=Sulfuricurvum sp. TaxID=2025608 RepID=UPI00261BF811|nr:hypothetical protein [Sulfuricurvum sp.]MDD2839310.1 hypothetical protein [Sulfuricurvum sp.]MDD3597950.1 hypothetical protein [Sulfuricurvum sp.]